MRNLKYLMFGILFIGLAGLSGCKKEGCTNPIASNYDSNAKKDDGSCVLADVNDPNSPNNNDARTPYLGKYLVTDSTAQAGGNNQWEVGNPYLIQVTTGNTVKDTLFINKLGGFMENRIVILSGDFFNVTTVDNTNIFMGNGQFDGNSISYQLKVNGPGPNPNLYGHGTKQ